MVVLYFLGYDVDVEEDNAEITNKQVFRGDGKPAIPGKGKY